MSESSDALVSGSIPLDAPTCYDTFEAKYMTSYLEDYVENHVYDRTSLLSRIFFGRRVHKIDKTGGIWKFDTEGSGGLQRLFQATKFVIATGNTSTPNMPSLPNQEEFMGKILHHRDFANASQSVLGAPSCKYVTVIGGGKSATDMVYEAVKKGKTVSWIIRKDGEGPTLYFPAATKNPRCKNSVEAIVTRLRTLTSASLFVPNLWLASLFHRSSFGRNYLN